MNTITPRVVKMITAAHLLAKDGYEGDEIASLLRGAASQIDGKKFIQTDLKYNPATCPERDGEWPIFNAALSVLWKKNNPGERFSGDRVHAISIIKIVREQTAMGLKESKDFTDANWDKIKF